MRTKVSFSRTKMQALELFWLAKMNVMGRSIEEIRLLAEGSTTPKSCMRFQISNSFQDFIGFGVRF